MNIKIFMAAAVAALTAACTPNAETVEVAAGPEAEAAFNAANTTEVVPDSEETPEAVSN